MATCGSLQVMRALVVSLVGRARPTQDDRLEAMCLDMRTSIFPEQIYGRGALRKRDVLPRVVLVRCFAYLEAFVLLGSHADRTSGDVARDMSKDVMPITSTSQG